MRLTTTYYNERIELLDGVYGTELHDEFHILPRLYNRILGPVTSVSLHRPELLDLSMYSSSSKHSPIGSLMRNLTVKMRMADPGSIPGAGKGPGMQQPFLGALAEIAERLLAVLYVEAILDQFVYASYEELVRQGQRALGPEEFPLFAPEQYTRPRFGYVPFRPDVQLRWVPATELLTGETLLVPAQMVLMSYKYHTKEARIGYPTSSGLAFHHDRRRAILHGLYELLERDATNVRWYCRLPPPRVDVNLIDFWATHLNVQRVRMSTPYIQGAQVFLTTLDMPVPSLTAVAIDRSRQERALMVGGGTGSGRERALAQALFELGQTRTALKFYEPIGGKNIRPNSDASEMTDFIDATVYFGYADNLSRLSWYTAGERVVRWETVPTFSYNDVTESYEATLDWLRAARLRPIVVDFSGGCWPDMSVTKVLVPQLTQAGVPSHPYLGHSRFYELPQQLGFADRPLEFRDLNPDPLPLP